MESMAPETDVAVERLGLIEEGAKAAADATRDARTAAFMVQRSEETLFDVSCQGASRATSVQPNEKSARSRHLLEGAI
jgi:hypothetical protein